MDSTSQCNFGLVDVQCMTVVKSASCMLILTHQCYAGLEGKGKGVSYKTDLSKESV